MPGRCITGAAPRSASSRTRRFSVPSRSVRRGCTGCAAPRPTCSAACEIRWACDPALLQGRQGRHAGRGGAAFPRRPARQPGGRYRRSPARAAADLGRRGRLRPAGRRGHRQGRMGRRLAGGGRGVPALLLQHGAHAAGRHARGRVSRRAGEGPARLGRAARQQAGGAGHGRRRCWSRWRRNCRCSCAIRSSRARPRRS